MPTLKAGFSPAARTAWILRSTVELRVNLVVDGDGLLNEIFKYKSL